MPSSLILGYSQCQMSIDWRANPDVETTDWRARRGKTAHRVRREGTVKAVSYPYPATPMYSTQLCIVLRGMKAAKPYFIYIHKIGSLFS